MYFQIWMFLLFFRSLFSSSSSFVCLHVISTLKNVFNRFQFRRRFLLRWPFRAPLGDRPRRRDLRPLRHPRRKDRSTLPAAFRRDQIRPILAERVLPVDRRLRQQDRLDRSTGWPDGAASERGDRDPQGQGHFRPLASNRLLLPQHQRGQVGHPVGAATSVTGNQNFWFFEKSRFVNKSQSVLFSSPIYHRKY